MDINTELALWERINRAHLKNDSETIEYCRALLRGKYGPDYNNQSLQERTPTGNILTVNYNQLIRDSATGNNARYNQFIGRK